MMVCLHQWTLQRSWSALGAPTESRIKLTLPMSAHDAQSTKLRSEARMSLESNRHPRAAFGSRSLRHLTVRGLALIAALVGHATTLHAQENPAAANPVAAWRVECSGDGKTLECRAFQQVLQQQSRQLIAHLAVRVPPDSKTPVMMIQLPLGMNLAEPLQLKVDNGAVERQPIQTCTATGCFAGMPLPDKLVAAMRSGTLLKLAFQDSNKRPITFDIPLLGFGLALDKAK
jgi:invasion protein IalB